MPDGIWRVPLWKKYFQAKLLMLVLMLDFELFNLFREALCRILLYSYKALAANSGGRELESHRGQNLFFTYYSIRVECEELLCKTNKNS